MFEFRRKPFRRSQKPADCFFRSDHTFLFPRKCDDCGFDLPQSGRQFLLLIFPESETGDFSNCKRFRGSPVTAEQFLFRDLPDHSRGERGFQKKDAIVSGIKNRRGLDPGIGMEWRKCFCVLFDIAEDCIFFKNTGKRQFLQWSDPEKKKRFRTLRKTRDRIQGVKKCPGK